MPGAHLLVETGTRSASLLVRIGSNKQPVRLNQKLAQEIWVVANPETPANCISED
jgi:hypothetical protein